MLNLRFSWKWLVVVLIPVLITCCSPVKTLPYGPDAVWDLVIIGDSSMWELGEAFAAQIEKDTGVKVIVHDYANNAASADEVLGVLQTGDSMNARNQGLPDAIKDAEVVIMNVNLEDSIDPLNPVNLDGCFLMMKPENCAPASFDTYTADLKAIWAEIYKLRKGKPVILRATDLYNPLVSRWKEKGVFEECNTCWVNFSEASRKAAEAYGIPFLSRLDAFNGLTHGEDPVLKGYIDEDGEHPSKLGAQYTAELFSKMGYEPVPEP